MLLRIQPRIVHALLGAALALLLIPSAGAQYVLEELVSPGEQENGYFGWATAGVPDTNGDGRGDLLVGAFGEEDGVTDGGRAYLLSGADGSLLQTLVSPNAQEDGIFGSAVASVPDADGDGRGDLLVGARVESTGGSPSGAGRAYLFSGATGALLFELASPNEEDFGFFGATVAGVPDANGDGRGDVLIGTVEDPGASPDEAGRAYLFSGADGSLLHTLASPNEEEDGFFGSSVAGVPDADGDGRGDLLVGAKQEDPDGSPTFAGRAYLFSGATGALLFELASPNEELVGDFGAAVAGVPDANGDGRGDLVIGAQREDPGASPGDAGRAYLFSGADGALLHTLVSPNEEVQGLFGWSVSGVPDTDGDGRGDLVVGAVFEDPSTSPSNAGRAYLFSGATGALLSVYVSPNEEGGGYFGFAVAGVPDADGDGRGDVLAGAYFEEPGGAPNAAGRAYLFKGGPLATTVAVAATPQDPPVVIDGNGGSFDFDVTLSNVTGDRQTVDAWASARLPNGALFGPVIGPRRLRVAGGFTIGPVTLRQSVPAPAPAGDYMLIVQTGQYPLAASVDSFAVEKTEDLPGWRSSEQHQFAVWQTVEVTNGSPVLVEETVPAETSDVMATRQAADTSVGAYPNPFVRRTEIAFSLEQASDVSLVIYDVRGREIAHLAEGARDAGQHSVVFDAASLPSGVYIYRLVTGTQVETGRLTLVR